ncbi:HD domain-containing protein [Evansella tamaricis]|uniref:HD domain-containing protein n=1 Tax=Evansella tamaricis TaxID=2069301 RepID=A0ABS6JHN1_9BACI|nr:HD domain-containing protein [Evansella tamaricis]MBU9713136.1 HD domain-containing protein [Evansella tamaricis]
MNIPLLLQEPLYPNVVPEKWEINLFQTKAVRRLKHLAHYGAGSLITSVTHSRFEHTIGVWKLASRFFPEDKLIRAAAILHDIGHLPFSHAVEKTLGYNHHKLTEEYIKAECITSILEDAGLDYKVIMEYLNKETALTGKDKVIGLDHLDSFFRDTYMSGKGKYRPKDIINRLCCAEEGIQTDEKTGKYLMELILSDHELFLSPLLLAADRLLAEAVTKHWEKTKENRDEIPLMTDNELIIKLMNSPSEETKELMEMILYQPNNIVVEHCGSVDSGIPVSVRKIYDKSPLVYGKPFLDSDTMAGIKNRLLSLKQDYEIRI